jgi:hypothetical protein
VPIFTLGDDPEEYITRLTGERDHYTFGNARAKHVINMGMHTKSWAVLKEHDCFPKGLGKQVHLYALRGLHSKPQQQADHPATKRRRVGECLRNREVQPA